MIRILLIEDNPGDARIIREMLTDSCIEFELVWSENLSKALSEIQSNVFDIILIDLALPDSWGIDTFIKVHGQAPDVPIIILTVFDVDDMAINAAQCGAQDYLIKNQINADLLKRSIRYAIERKKSEAALRESEEKYRLLLENLNDIIYQADIEGNLTYINNKGLEALEVANDDIIGRPWIENIHPDDMDDFSKAYQKMLIAGKPVIDYECRFVAKRGKGRVFPVIQNIGVLKDEAENTNGTQGIAHDISTRKKAEVELYNSHKQLTDIINFLPDATFVIDENKNVIAWNLVMEDLTGVSEEEIMGKGDYTYAEPFYGIKRPILIDLVFLDAEEVKSSYNYLKKEGDKIFGEAFVPTLNEGKGAHLWGLASPLYDRKGDIIGAIESIRDITEWKRTEKSLRDAHKQLTDIIEFLPEATFVIDMDKKVIAWNRAIEEMTGVRKEEIIGKGDYSYAEPFYGTKKPILIDLIFSGNDETETSYESINRIKNTLFAEVYLPKMHGGKGGYFWGTASPLLDNEGNLVGAIESIRDVTEKKRSEEALREANSKLNLLSSVTRHDVLNKLMGLSGYVLLLDELLPRDLAMQNCINHIMELTSTIQRQIIFTRDYQDMGVKEPEWQNLAAAINRAAKSISLGNIQLKVAVSQMEIFADPMLEKVFSNIFEDAVIHGEKATEIKVSFHEDETNGIIIVEDDGIGINEEDKTKIFDCNYGKNTGFGLFLVKEILSITGMSIIETGEEGKGARFEIKVSGENYRVAE